MGSNLSFYGNKASCWCSYFRSSFQLWVGRSFNVAQLLVSLDQWPCLQIYWWKTQEFHRTSNYSAVFIVIFFPVLSYSQLSGPWIVFYPLLNPTWHDFRYLFLSKLVSMSGASGAFLRLLLVQVNSLPLNFSCYQLNDGISHTYAYIYKCVLLKKVLLNMTEYNAVSFLSYFHWSFPIYINNARGEAIWSGAIASTGTTKCSLFMLSLIAI